MSELSKLFGAAAEPTPTAPPTNFTGNYRLNKARLDVQTVAKVIIKREGARDELIRQLSDARQKLAQVEKDLGHMDLVQILLEETSEAARESVRQELENIVSEALNVVYGGNHKFIIKLTNGQHGPESEYWLYDGAVMSRLRRPDYGRGGGKIDVISTTLKLVVGEIIKAAGPRWLDEVGKHIDAEAAPNFAYFVKQFAEKFDRQTFFVTHNDAIAGIGDTAHQVKKVNDVAVVTRT
jgi:DNA repair ATPase RecN